MLAQLGRKRAKIIGERKKVSLQFVDDGRMNQQFGMGMYSCAPRGLESSSSAGALRTTEAHHEFS
jgi:hypothetical protein